MMPAAFETAEPTRRTADRPAATAHDSAPPDEVAAEPPEEAAPDAADAAGAGSGRRDLVAGLEKGLSLIHI